MLLFSFNSALNVQHLFQTFKNNSCRMFLTIYIYIFTSFIKNRVIFVYWIKITTFSHLKISKQKVVSISFILKECFLD